MTKDAVPTKLCINPLYNYCLGSKALIHNLVSLNTEADNSTEDQEPPQCPESVTVVEAGPQGQGVENARDNGEVCEGLGHAKNVEMEVAPKSSGIQTESVVTEVKGGGSKGNIAETRTLLDNL